MASGFTLTIPLFPAKNGRHITRTLIGLGNRCSILLSYGASGSFPRFPMVKGQASTRKTRQGGRNDMARKVAQPVSDTFPGQWPEGVADYPWCESCFGPVIPTPFRERALAWVCYWLAIYWPHRLFMNRMHRAILPWAGNIAFRCHCTRLTSSIGA